MGWILIALVGLAVPAGLLMALRTNPAAFPYLMVLVTKVMSVTGPILKNFSRAEEVPDDEYYKSMGEFRLANAKRLRDALVELERVPTIRKGLDSLGYKSMVECFVKRDYFKRSSPYTHPLQQPFVFLPGIPAHTFYDPSEFEWAKVLEDNFDVIRGELDAVLAGGGRGFKTYRTEFATDEKYWNTFNLFVHGEKIEENCALVPRTAEILESLPRFEKNHIMFSALNPKSHLPRHVGPINGIMRGHLPLIVPPGCRIQVGDDVREWEEGKVMVFDDSFFHEVWNESDQVRVVLFTNFWHPSIPDEDIAAIEHFRHVFDTEAPGAAMWRKAQQEPRPHTIAGADGPVPPLKAS